MTIASGGCLVKIANRKYLGAADANAVYYYHFDAPFDYMGRF